MDQKQLLFMASVLAPSAGCSHVEGEIPLTPEHAQQLNELLEHEPAATEMVVALAEKMDEGMVDAYGDPATQTELGKAIRSTSDWLHEQHETGRIMEVDPAKFPTADTIASYDTESSRTHEDDRMVLSSDASTWNLPGIIHEAGHKTFIHDLFVTQAIRESGAELNGGFSAAVKEYRDYSYLLTALYAVPSSLVEQTRKDLEILFIEDSLSREQLKDLQTMPSPEEVEAELQERYADLEPLFEGFGLSLQDLSRAYRESGMHEALQEWRISEVQAYRERGEMRLEMERGEKKF
jgi:hypothetical protein